MQRPERAAGLHPPHYRLLIGIAHPIQAATAVAGGNEYSGRLAPGLNLLALGDGPLGVQSSHGHEQAGRATGIHARVFNNLIDARDNLANNSMNQALRNLTLINVVFLPLNLVASIGGMSEFSMMTGSLPWWVSFPTLIVGMVVLAVGMVVRLKRLV